MNKLTIIYQHNRKQIPCNFYYPEDEKTPKQRVDFIEKYSKDEMLKSYINITVVSACPYVIEAFIKYFKNRKVVGKIGNKNVKINTIFKELSNPMSKMVFA